MTRVFDAEGRSVAVSKVLVLPAAVSQIRSNEKDGYSAVQIQAVKGEGEKTKVIRTKEFRALDTAGYKKGKKITIEQFIAGDVVDVTGTSKGKGFAGTIKRHGFKRGPESHGGNNVREPGSIGAQQPQRVVLGRRMAGHMGAATVTVKNLKVVDVDKDILLVSGAIPGPNKGILQIVSRNASSEPVAEEVAEQENAAEEVVEEEKTEDKTE